MTQAKTKAGCSSVPLEPLVGRPAVVCVDSWAGRQEKPCRVVRETPTRYVIEVDQPTGVPPGFTIMLPGQQKLVPKRAVRLLPPNGGVVGPAAAGGRSHTNELLEGAATARKP